MVDTQLNRKLTTILYADIAGYSRLSGADEEGTHRKVMQVFDDLEVSIKQASGAVVNSAGDTILAVFPSVVAATNTAIELSPRDPMLWAFTAVHAMTCLLDNDNEEGLILANQTKQIPTSTGYWSHALLAAALANLDRMAEAQKALAEKKAAEKKAKKSIKGLNYGDERRKKESEVNDYVIPTAEETLNLDPKKEMKLDTSNNLQQTYMSAMSAFPMKYGRKK